MNIIALGYRRAGSSVESFHPNPLHSHFISSIWTNVLAQCGDDVVSFLLLNCSIFVHQDINTNCLLQICGPPVSELITSVPPSFHDAKTKRTLRRLAMMYGKPILPSCYKAVGLPANRK